MKAAVGATGFLALAATGGLIAIAAMSPILVGDDPTDLSAAPVACMLPGDGTTAAGLSAEQVGNANTIISTGKTLGFPTKGLVVAIATAMQESTLHNLSTGDQDSVGLFQQRAPWGTFAERTDPATATTMFLTGGHGGQRGLEDIDGWEAMPVWQAAQAVQVSAFPQAYAKWEPLAVELVGGVSCDNSTDFSALPGSTAGEKAVNAAARWLGTPYSWGGGNYDGPTRGIAQGANTVGFDCSGLTMYAWFQAAGIRLPHLTDLQAARTVPVSKADAQAGDLIFFTGSGGGAYPHMGMYDGQGGMLHAPRTGKNVERVANIFTDPYWSARIGLIGRPSLGGAAA